MKRIRLIVDFSILLMFCQVFMGVAPSVLALDTNNFHFSDFTADYYLYKDSEGISHLKVVESVTAVFPNFEQNKGICRQIPFTNKNGTNITLSRLTEDDITVTRNGVEEPIYSIEKEKDYYNVCTGTDEYVLGVQTYEFTYRFSKVVTEFSESGRKYQELYWDTNGNGASQRFDSVTARVHFEDENVFSGKSWCYVGKYGGNDQTRCSIEKISDGVQFSALNLSSFEGLTFDVELKEGSFKIPEPELDYTYVWLFAILVGLCVLIVIRFIRKFLKTREKANYYKGYFVKPEYQPNKDYSLGEMAEIYIGDKKDVKVAMLLEMVVNKKIDFQKGEKKRDWNIIINTLDGVSPEEVSLLTILNDGTSPKAGDVIKIKRHTATVKLVNLKKAMETKILEDLKKDGLVEKDYSMGSSGKRGIANIISMTIIIVPVIIAIGFFILGMLSDFMDLSGDYGKFMVFKDDFMLNSFIVIVVTTIVSVVLSDASQKYESHTNKGLEASRYMDGLRLYIEMAEAERMKVLQSVKGADVSAKGIVKLYEKLLPYAAVFGLEESWMDEMKEYCELEEIEQPDYLMTGIAVSEIVRGLNRASTLASDSTTFMSSSGGGSSSGFSGGGGGGFSGGGGGGGGFSGR
ncbi:DUF2207 domain-containing protein [Candidatus Saccharibacteria bacterium]|nr:DUF2207 domain-containing protein [Candidatus Saccharibacteria bacterium]